MLLVEGHEDGPRELARFHVPDAGRHLDVQVRSWLEGEPGEILSQKLSSAR